MYFNLKEDNHDDNRLTSEVINSEVKISEYEAKNQFISSQLKKDSKISSYADWEKRDPKVSFFYLTPDHEFKYTVLSYSNWDGKILSIDDNTIRIRLINKSYSPRYMNINKKYFIKRGIKDEYFTIGSNFCWTFKRIRLEKGQERNVNEIYFHQTLRITHELLEQKVNKELEALSFLFE